MNFGLTPTTYVLRVPLLLATLALSACPSDDAPPSSGTTSGSTGPDDTSGTTASVDPDTTVGVDSSSGSGTTMSPPGSDTDTDSGPSETDGDSTDSTGTDTGTAVECGDDMPGPPHTLCGEVTSQVAPGGDGLGTVWVVATQSCDELVNEQIVGIRDADLSEIGNSVPFTVEVPADGTWYLAAFLDEDSDGMPALPFPEIGDMANLEGPTQLTCLVLGVSSDMGGIVYELTDVI